jgi:hypothetical protein
MPCTRTTRRARENTGPLFHPHMHSPTDTHTLTHPHIHSRAHTCTHTAVSGCPVVDVLRRGDILAALCQEEQGDHSAVTREEFESAVKSYAGVPYPLSSGPAPVHGCCTGTGVSASKSEVPRGTRCILLLQPPPRSSLSQRACTLCVLVLNGPSTQVLHFCLPSCCSAERIAT